MAEPVQGVRAADDRMKRLGSTADKRRERIEQAKAITKRSTVFLLSGVAVGLLPLIIAALDDNRTGAINIAELLSGGELLIVSVAIVVAAGAELFGGTSQTEIKRSTALLIVIFVLFIVAVMASATYAEISSATIKERLKEDTSRNLQSELDSNSTIPSVRTDVAMLLDTEAQGKLIKAIVSAKAGISGGISSATTTRVTKELKEWENSVRSESLAFFIIAILSGIFAITVSERTQVRRVVPVTRTPEADGR